MPSAEETAPRATTTLVSASWITSSLRTRTTARPLAGDLYVYDLRAKPRKRAPPDSHRKLRDDEILALGHYVSFIRDQPRGTIRHRKEQAITHDGGGYQLWNAVHAQEEMARARVLVGAEREADRLHARRRTPVPRRSALDLRGPTQVIKQRYPQLELRTIVQLFVADVASARLASGTASPGAPASATSGLLPRDGPVRVDLAQPRLLLARVHWFRQQRNSGAARSARPEILTLRPPIHVGSTTELLSEQRPLDRAQRQSHPPGKSRQFIWAPTAVGSAPYLYD